MLYQCSPFIIIKNGLFESIFFFYKCKMQNKVSDKEVLYVKKSRFDPKKITFNLFLKKLEERIQKYYVPNNLCKTEKQ